MTLLETNLTSSKDWSRHVVTIFSNAVIVIATVTAFIQTSLLSALSHAAEMQTINVLVWQGTMQEHILTQLAHSYENRTGISVNLRNVHRDMSLRDALGEATSAKMDIIALSPLDELWACQNNFLTPLDPNAFPLADPFSAASPELLQGRLTPCSVAISVYAHPYAYFESTNEFGKRPSSIEDFFDVKKFPGERGMFHTPQLNMELALMADGVPKSRVYEELATYDGRNRALTKIESIEDSILWLDSLPQVGEFVENRGGEYAMCQFVSPQRDVLADIPNAFFVWNDVPIDFDYMSILQHSEQSVLAMQFLLDSVGDAAADALTKNLQGWASPHSVECDCPCTGSAACNCCDSSYIRVLWDYWINYAPIARREFEARFRVQ